MEGPIGAFIVALAGRGVVSCNKRPGFRSDKTSGLCSFVMRPFFRQFPEDARGEELRSQTLFPLHKYPGERIHFEDFPVGGRAAWRCRFVRNSRQPSYRAVDNIFG